MAKKTTFTVGRRKYKYDYKSCLLKAYTLKGEFLMSMGLSKDNWEDGPKYWIDEFAFQIDEETNYLMAEFKAAMAD